MLIDTSTILSVTWFGLESTRRELPKIFYTEVLKVDPSLELVYSVADVEARSESFVTLVDQLVSGMLSRDVLTKLGVDLVHNGFNRHQVEQYADIFLASLKTVYGQSWTTGIDDAWTRMIAKASFFIQGADRRRLSV